VEAAPAPAPASPTPEAGPTPPPLRLVGIVHRTGRLRAAVATPDGGVVIVGPGDQVAGFTVLGVDEDRGLRLRTPDGAEVSLVPGGG
jgi:hypothetical protein